MAAYHLKLKTNRHAYNDIAILDFAPAEGKLSFKPGQYMHLYVSSLDEYISRPYTIISSPQDESIRFAIREKGEVSSILYKLEPDAVITADGPHGNLCLPAKSKSLVCISAGIGITPFLSWIGSVEPSENPFFRILTSNKTEESAPFLDDLFEMAEKDGRRVSVASFLTGQQKKMRHASTLRRINMIDIKTALADMPEAAVAICGPVDFVHDMWKAAQSLNIPEDRIFTEAFY